MIAEELQNNNDNLKRYRERLSNFSKEFEIGLFIYLLRKSKLYILIILTLIFTLGFLYLRYTPETFETNSIIQINIKDQGEEILNINSFEQTNNINSIVELMKSEIIINRVFKKLNLSPSYFSEGEILSRNIYKNTPFLIKDINIKDSSSILEQKIYVKLNEPYIEFHNEEETVYHSKYIQPNEYFSTPFFLDSSMLKILIYLKSH